MKKAIALFVVIVVTISLFTGCNIGEKASEKLTEKILEGAMGGDGKVDMSSGGITIKDKDGNETTIGDTKWPTSKAADLLPKCNKGKIAGVINSTNTCMVTLQDVELGDYEAYINNVKGAGFTTDPYELDVDGVKSYAAKKDEKTLLSVIFTPQEKGMVITLGIEK